MHSMLSAQVTDVEESLRTVTADSLDGWKKGAILNVGMAQTSLTNWAAGGESSIAINGLLSAFANLTKGRTNWDNTLDIGYGSVKKGKGDFIKTDDKIDLSSKLGYDAFEKWNYAAFLSFKTQMTNGYNESGEEVISKLLAPGYILAAAGLDYKPNDIFSAFIAPLTTKITLVMDDSLSAAGAFGVETGNSARSELGGYVRMAFSKEILKNISLSTKIDLFSNYLNNPQDIDVNWEALLTLKANKYISTTLATHLIYDKDILIPVESDAEGNTIRSEPRVQFKEMLSVGLTVTF